MLSASFIIELNKYQGVVICYIKRIKHFGFVTEICINNIKL